MAMREQQTVTATDRHTRWYRLEPTDAWFFRDGRPSNRGENQSDIVSQFPPNSATVVGALRAALARSSPYPWDGHSDWSDEIKQVLGDGNDLGTLSFIGPLLEKDGQIVFPMPRHVLGRATDNGKTFTPLDWLVPSKTLVQCDLGHVCLPTPKGICKSRLGEKAPSSTEQFFVTTSAMTAILAGERPSPEDCIHRDDLFVLESRVGIARDVDSRTTGEGAMYSPRYVRLRRNVALVVGVAGLPADDWAMPHYIALGGESRFASCEPIDARPLPKQSLGDEPSVLVLATPACFAGNKDWFGARPAEDASALSAELSGTVITTTFDRPIGIGGWNGIHGRPHSLVPHVRPGTVWWLESAKAIDTNLSSSGFQLGNKTSFGYGLAFLGKQTPP